MVPSPKIRVMIAEDHYIVRQGFVTLLNQTDNITVIGEADNGANLLELANKQMPDIVITDLRMPGMDGFSLLEHLSKEMPLVKTIVLSMYSSDQLTSKLILSGASSCLHKSCEADELIYAITKVANDGYYFNSKVTRNIIQATWNYKSTNTALEELALSEREIEILCLVCSEKTTQQIADLLNIKPVTVDFHKKNIYKKTKIGSNVGLVKFAIRNGLEID